MLLLLVLLFLLWVGGAVAGFVIHGLAWLAVICLLLAIVTAAVGLIRGRR